MKKLLLTLALLLIPFQVLAVTALPQGRGWAGDLTISSSRTEDSVKSNLTARTATSTQTITVASPTGFKAGDYIFLYQAQLENYGNWEVNKIGEVSGSNLLLTSPLKNIYQATKAQAIKINEYSNVTIADGGIWTASAWNGTTGGILVAMISGDFNQTGYGTTTVAGLGLTGGATGGVGTGPSYQGDSERNIGSPSTGYNTLMGGSGNQNVSSPNACGGGGGGHQTIGGAGASPAFCVGSQGGVVGLDSFTLATSTYFGGAGGGGAGTSPTNGGAGGGLMFIFSGDSINISKGAISARGGSSSVSGTGASGGAGAGGSMRLVPKVKLDITPIDAGTGQILATAGTASSGGGSGGEGRIATVSGIQIIGDSNPHINSTSTDFVHNLDNDAIQISLGMAF